MNEEGFVMITNFQWNTDSYFKWSYQGKELKKEYDRPISSVVKLTDNTGFAIVLSEIDYGSKNAFILNADGTERVRINIPSDLKDVICFSEMYYILGELTAIIVTRSVDFACVINSNNGSVIRIYETR